MATVEGAGAPKKNDGGAAFPVDSSYYTKGMSLRDWFAGLSIQKSIPHDDFIYTKEDAEKISNRAYMMADAMLKEREK